MRRFVSVVKPGIIFGNAVTVCGGFFLGSFGHINLLLLLLTLLGMSLVIGSGCVFNNYIDRDIDRLMERTRNRVLVKGLISPKLAIVYGIILGILGFALLYAATNPLTVLLAAIGWFVYVVVYSLSMKRKSSSGTLVGGIAGAIPPVVGYAAVTDRFDVGAILLFLILFLWQMPHFYAIAIYRLQDYKAAGIPVLPLRKNIYYTKVVMLLYVIAYALVTLLPTYFGYTRYAYFVTALILGVIWFCYAIEGITAKDDKAWARKMFSFSILSITVLCIVMAIKF